MFFQFLRFVFQIKTCIMARIMALDYGKKRTGVAVTDPLQLIATALDTIDTHSLIRFLEQYFAQEPVDRVLIGYPLNFDESPTHATPLVEEFLKRFRKRFPQMPIETMDERLTSVIASREIRGMGLKKKDRQRKELIDAVSAVMMLQEYMQSRQ